MKINFMNADQMNKQIRKFQSYFYVFNFIFFLANHFTKKISMNMFACDTIEVTFNRVTKLSTTTTRCLFHNTQKHLQSDI